MVFRHKHLFIVSAVVAMTSPLWAADPSPGKLMKERLDVMKATQAIQAEQSKATAPLQADAGNLASLANTMKGPALTTQQAADGKARLETLKRELDAAQRNLTNQEKYLELGAITDPAARAAKAKELQDQAAAASKKLSEASAPFAKQLEETKKPLEKSDEDFVAMLDKCMKQSSGKYAGATRRKLTWSSPYFNGQVHWQEDALTQKDNQGKDDAWLAVFMQPAPYEKPTYAGAKLIDGKYQYSAGGTNIWVQAGYFNLSLSVNKKEWQGDEAELVDLVKNLINLDAVAALKPE